MKKYKLYVAILAACTLNMSLIYPSAVNAQENTITDQGDMDEVVPSISDHEHIWESTRTYDETECWLACTVEGCIVRYNVLEHQLIEVIDRKPTETEAGIAHYECTMCEYKSTPFDIAYYAPTASTNMKEWNGTDEIVINVDTKGGRIDDYTVTLVSESSAFGTAVNPVINLDDNGIGTVTFSQDEISRFVEALSRTGHDVSEFDSITFVIGFVNLDTNPVRSETCSIEIPINCMEENEKEPITLTDISGVSMTFPGNVAANLALRVVVTNGEIERNAVEEVTQIESDRIKTFDLSLWQNGGPYIYQGQFDSTISIPIPDGWDVNQLLFYYFNENTNKVESVPFEVDRENLHVVFDTTHFSRYILVQKASAETNDFNDSVTTQSDNRKKDNIERNSITNTSNPQTGDTTKIEFYGISLVVMGVIVIVILRKRHCFFRNN